MKKELSLELTTEGKKAVIAFNNAATPLGQRSAKDLLDFAIMARQARRDDYMGFFKELPPLQEMIDARTDRELKDVSDNGPIGPLAPTPASALTGTGIAEAQTAATTLQGEASASAPAAPVPAPAASPVAAPESTSAKPATGNATTNK